jgi:hypothetical protein
MQFSGAKVHLVFPSQWLKLYVDEYLVGEPVIEYKDRDKGDNHE